MNWFKEQRLQWIKESVEIYGFINREHVQKKFHIGVAQASHDLQEAQERWPLLMYYDPSAKHYRHRI